MAQIKTKTAAIAFMTLLMIAGLTTVTTRTVKRVRRNAVIAGIKQETPPGSLLNNPFNRVILNNNNREKIFKLRAEVWPSEIQATEKRIKSYQQADRTSGAVTIDLRPFVNAQLSEGPLGPQGNNSDNLAEVPPGRHVFGGVPFEVSGVVYLNGGWLRHYKKDFPTAVNTIRIDRRCGKIHLFHGASLISFDDAGRTVARLVLHYADGSRQDLNIDAARQAIDWWAPLFQTGVNPMSLQTAPDTVPAWTGKNPMIKREQQDESLVLCRTTFDNPQPSDVLSSIDYVSMNTMTVPFMLGLTVE